MKVVGWNYPPKPQDAIVTTRIIPFLYSRESGVLGAGVDRSGRYPKEGPMIFIIGFVSGTCVVEIRDDLGLICWF